MTNSIEINNLNKMYESFSLKDVSFNVKEGYITGFIGPNGAGKTTVLKSILQMTKINNGDIKIFNKTFSDDKSYFEDIGIVMDYQFYSNDWTPIDVEKAISGFYSQWDHNEYFKYLDKFKLDKKKKIKELSRGMKVKLMLSVTFSHNAKLLILDEPTSGLDPVARDELMEIFQEYMSDENNSILFSTHITSDLEKIADYIVFIRDGKIIFDGEKDSLLERYLLVKGGIDDIDASLKNKIIGYKEHSSWFEGLIDINNKEIFNQSLVFEKTNLDEIIVFLNKEENHG